MINLLIQASSGTQWSWRSLLPSITGVVGGAILSGVFVQAYWKRRENESKAIDSLIDGVNSIQVKTLEYWSIDCQVGNVNAQENEEKARGLAIFITAEIFQANSNIREYTKKYCRNRKDDFLQYMTEVQDACTNGKYNVSGRPADPDRLKLVMNATNRVREELMRRHQ